MTADDIASRMALRASLGQMITDARTAAGAARLAAADMEQAATADAVQQFADDLEEFAARNTARLAVIDGHPMGQPPV